MGEAPGSAALTLGQGSGLGGVLVCLVRSRQGLTQEVRCAHPVVTPGHACRTLGHGMKEYSTQASSHCSSCTPGGQHSTCGPLIADECWWRHLGDLGATPGVRRSCVCSLCIQEGQPAKRAHVLAREVVGRALSAPQVLHNTLL